MSPLTVTFCRLGRALAKHAQSASVLTRGGQKPWNVPTFSHHVRTSTSRAHQHLERGRAVDHLALEQVQHGVALVVDEECEGDNEALKVV